MFVPTPRNQHLVVVGDGLEAINGLASHSSEFTNKVSMRSTNSHASAMHAKNIQALAVYAYAHAAHALHREALDRRRLAP